MSNEIHTSREALEDERSASRLVLYEEEGPPTIGDLFRATPGLARVAFTAGLHGAARATNAYVGTVSRVVRATAQGEPPGQVVQEGVTELRAYARGLLGLSEGTAGNGAGVGPRRGGADEASTEVLRRRGSELLRRSADIKFEEASHPAYMRILESLAPDEGRILRFLARNGGQPSVDVRSGLPLVSELVAPGCNMIAAEAGCRHTAFTRAYMDNLHRLGLIWFSREPVKDPRRYQVLEAQPEVTEAREKGGRLSRTVRRSILLTPFGEDFCAVCLPVEELELLAEEPPPAAGPSS